jgi:hypothetical protein
MKTTEKIRIDNLKYDLQSSNFDKIIMTPPFLPNPDFSNEVENKKSFEKINENFNNFRFQSIFIFIFKSLIEFQFKLKIMNKTRNFSS